MSSSKRRSRHADRPVGPAASRSTFRSSEPGWQVRGTGPRPGRQGRGHHSWPPARAGHHPPPSRRRWLIEGPRRWVGSIAEQSDDAVKIADRLVEHIDQLRRSRPLVAFQMFFQGVHQGRQVAQAHAAGGSLERVKAAPEFSERRPGSVPLAEAKYQRLDPFQQVRRVGQESFADLLVEIDLSAGSGGTWNAAGSFGGWFRRPAPQAWKRRTGGFRSGCSSDWAGQASRRTWAEGAPNAGAEVSPWPAARGPRPRPDARVRASPLEEPQQGFASISRSWPVSASASTSSRGSGGSSKPSSGAGITASLGLPSMSCRYSPQADEECSRIQSTMPSLPLSALPSARASWLRAFAQKNQPRPPGSGIARQAFPDFGEIADPPQGTRTPTQPGSRPRSARGSRLVPPRVRQSGQGAHGQGLSESARQAPPRRLAREAGSEPGGSQPLASSRPPLPRPAHGTVRTRAIEARWVKRLAGPRVVMPAPAGCQPLPRLARPDQAAQRRPRDRGAFQCLVGSLPRSAAWPAPDPGSPRPGRWWSARFLRPGVRSARQPG